MHTDTLNLPAGQVELKLKTPWRDGTAHLVVSPLEFMQRLAALVPLLRMLAPALFPRRSWANSCFASTDSGH